MKNLKLKKIIKESDNRLKKYKKMILESERSFRQLNSHNMQDVLIQIEDLFDSNHIYVFKNWIDGVIWDGPNIKRHWVDIVLCYPYNKMPEPKGAMRLVDMGVKVIYKESERYTPIEVKNPEDINPVSGKPKEKKEPIWLIELHIPRRFISGAIEDDIEDDENQNEETTQQNTKTNKQEPKEIISSEESEEQ